MTAGAPVISAKGLSRRFGDLVAVQDVSFDVQRGAIFGLLGPNGSGKSTIIRMLLGILPPSAGDARVLGCNVRQQPERIKPLVGYMSQQFSLYGDLSVRENLEFYGRIYGLDRAKIGGRIAETLELTSLSDRVDQLAGTLSGGWKQRLALGCALIHQPELLFLDEPTAGIDPVARRQLWDLLFELSARGVTLLVTTHYMDEAERCSHVGYIYMSRLLTLGRPSDLKQLPEVTPPGSKRYEARVASPAERLAPLRRLDEVRDATMFGETIRLLVDAEASAEELLSRVGASDADVRETPPLLEDVFVSLTKAAERGEGPSHHQAMAEHEETTAAPEKVSPPGRSTFSGLWAIMAKEFAHIRRQPSTLFFMLVVPAIQTIIFGYAIDTQIENIPMAVYDLDGRRHARELVEAFENTRRFATIDRVHSDEALRRAMVSGRAKVGLVIPPNYSDRLIRGEQAQVQVLIDGSDSQVATTALNTSQLLGLNLSIAVAKTFGDRLGVAPARDPAGRGGLPVQTRPRLLYNPDLESAYFFVPGLVAIILQLVTLFLTSFAVVREREVGTLEQLFVTPVGRAGLLLGKLTPYAIVGFVETLIVLTVMVYLFGVPIRGSLTLLLTLSTVFMICSLGLGLFVSTLAKTQLEAMQFAFIIMLPSILLSGFMFPRSEMPWPIYLVTFAIPATYFIDILRGVVLRGATLVDLLSPTLGLTVCCLVVLSLSVARFQKRLK